jgi:phenylalanyl-tRNA synthetase beta chain
MKLSLNWLKEFIDVPFTPKELDDRLTMLGIEVEKIEDAASRFAKIVVGEVLEAEKHPNADKLRVTRVSIGGAEPLRIVCGAPNARAGIKVAVATIGADLGGGFVIKKSKIRGEISEGMLCSERELGMSEEHNGILELPLAYVVGTPLAEAMGKSDVIIEIGITPNRPDCLSHIGIAREIAAITQSDVTLPSIQLPASTLASKATVTLGADDLCPRYAGRSIHGVTVAESPVWLKSRLESLGLRPINNIVDVTNLVLMECGHPLHAFDAAQIKDEHIIVRRAEGFATEFTTLDNKKRKLDPNTLLISDSEKPLAIAGIMGGLNSEIAPTTTNIFIESAYFLPSSIRRSSKRLGLSTDASYRFERGTDFDNVNYALDRATALILELAGGEIAGTRIDEYPKPIAQKKFEFAPAHAEALLGMKIGKTQMLDVFARLNIAVDQSHEKWQLTSPTYRIDLERPEDAIEELARVIGYENIPLATSERLPLPTTKEPLNRRELDLLLRSNLLALGATECVSSPLIAEKEARLFNNSPVVVVNPLNIETNRMRTSVAANLLDIARRNERFGADSQRLFESGAVFSYASQKQITGKINERTEIGILFSGNQESKSPYNATPQKADIFLAIGFAEQVIKRCGIMSLQRVPLAEIAELSVWSKQIEVFASELTVVILGGGNQLAVAGKASQAVQDAYDIRHDVYLVLIDYDALFELAKRARTDGKKVKALPKYPAVERDLALILNGDVSASTLEKEIEQSVPKELMSGFRVFDEFRSPEMKAAGERSLAVRIVLRSNERTLEELEVEQTMRNVVEKLTKNLGARLRV